MPASPTPTRPFPRRSPTCCSCGSTGSTTAPAGWSVRRRAPTARHDYAVLAKVVGLPEEQLDDALRSAIDHKVLTRIGDESYQFRHALLAEAIRDDLLPGERRRIHAAYLDALTTSDPADRPPRSPTMRSAPANARRRSSPRSRRPKRRRGSPATTRPPSTTSRR